jgi:parvulin-like peptidyl-prolyl isomerase
MTNYFKLIIIIEIVFNLNLLAQEKENVIATIGNQKVSEREFKLRYELVPHYTRDQFNEDSSKIDLLNSIIAEKLLAQEANFLGLDTTSYFQYSINQIKEIYVRDELYKRVVDSKVEITKSDIQNALNRRSKFLHVRIISANDSLSIYNYYNQLLHGASFDSLGKITDPIEYDSNKPPLKITYGQMEDDYVEDTLYSLQLGQFSSPIRTTGGWFIFRLNGIDSEVPANANDPNYNRTIKNVIRVRKSRVIGLRYLSQFYKDKKAYIDSTLFLKLVGKISSILIEKEKAHDFGRENKLFLDERSIMKILNDFKNSGDDEYIVKMEGKPIKLKEYLYSLIIYPLLTKDPSFNYVAYLLMENLNKYVQYKFLSEEGFKEGLENISSVKENIKIWHDNYLAKMLRNKFQDSIIISDDDVRKYYKDYKGSEKVDILEILNNNLDIIDTIFKQLKAGRDFRDLAVKYTQRAWTKNKGGEFGFFPISSLGVIGEVASKLKINQVYGPISTDSGYSIIKLINRKMDTTRIESDFDSIKEELKDELSAKKFNEKFFGYIAKLAEKYKFSINEKELKSVKVINIPMFTYKYIGFGGKIAAMPFLDAWYDWVKYLNKKPNLLP